MNTRDVTTRPGWKPPHCPDPNCKHHKPSPVGWKYIRKGFFYRRTKPHKIQRYQCTACGRNFSAQNFSPTYRLKRPDLLPKVFLAIANGMAARQCARALGCSPSAVDNLIARLARQCMLFHLHHRQKASPPVDVAIDGFVSFEFSQYFPFEHPVLVDRLTSFFEYFTDAPLRRSGRMTAKQKRRREQLEQRLGRPGPRAVEKAVIELLEVGLAGATKVDLWSDDHRAYPRAIARQTLEILHRRVSSRALRDRENPLFEINSLDMNIRHALANHRRETIAFSKRRQGSADRLAIFLVWKNYVKRRWEKRCRKTPAMLRGITARPLTVGDILAERLFPGIAGRLPPRWAAYYWRRVETPVLGRNRRHELTYAF